MVLEPVCCPHCHTTEVVKNGKSAEGKQRYRCRNTDCSRASFILDYTYRGHVPEVKQQVSELAMNGSGIRDTARVLKISPTPLIGELKKHRHLASINRSALASRQELLPAVMVVRVEAEMDEMWSFV